MYNVPDASEFNPLFNKEVTQLCISPYQIILRFEGDISFSIQGTFNHIKNHVIINNKGTIPEQGISLISLLDQKIDKIEINSPKEFTLEFFNSEKLNLLDDDENYESFVIMGPDIEIII